MLSYKFDAWFYLKQEKVTAMRGLRQKVNVTPWYDDMTSFMFLNLKTGLKTAIRFKNSNILVFSNSKNGHNAIVYII